MNVISRRQSQWSIDLQWHKLKRCLRSWMQLDGSMRDCCAKSSSVGFWIPLIPKTKPSIKWEPESGVGFSLILLTILNPLLSFWTHPPSCAACRPPLSPRPSNGSDFYYLGWWDIHKETLCQQDGKHVSRSVLVCFLERSLKSNRALGSPLCSSGYAVWHHLAGGNWWGMRGVTGSLMAVYYIGFLQQSHMNICACHFQWPTSGPQYHYRKLSGIRSCLWRYQQLGYTQWLPQGGESQLSVKKSLSLHSLALIHDVTVQGKSFWRCTLYWFLFMQVFMTVVVNWKRWYQKKCTDVASCNRRWMKCVGM